MEFLKSSELRCVPVLIFSFIVFFQADTIRAASANENYRNGNHSYQLEEWERAAEYYQAALDIDPELWEAYMGLGNAHYQLREMRRALWAYDRSLELNPENPKLADFVEKLKARLPPEMQPANRGAVRDAIGSGKYSTPGWGDGGAFKKRNGKEPSNALPEEGSHVWVLGCGLFLFNTDEFFDFYGPSSGSQLGTPLGGEVHPGIDFTLGRNFQLGGRLDWIFRLPINVSGYYDDGFWLYYFSDKWTTQCLGGSLVCRALLPLGRNSNFIIGGRASWFTLVGSKVDANFDGYPYRVDLSGSAPGGFLGFGIETFPGQGGWSVEMTVGYRFLTISPVTGESGGVKATLLNQNGSNGRIDFSGPRLEADFRFY